MTVAELLHRAAEQLAPVAGRIARLEAEVLLAAVRGQSRARLMAELRDPVREAEETALAGLVARRRAGEPLAYLVGRREFMSLEFLVSPAVLVPRPETELLVETALRILANFPRPRPTVVDVGTGSGNIALSLAHYAPQVRVLAVDISRAALAVARANADRLGLRRRVMFFQGDLLAPLLKRMGRILEVGKRGMRAGGTEFRRFRCRCRDASLFVSQADLIVANLPYIPTGSWGNLPPELRYEPRVALDGGPDGLLLYRRLFRQAPVVLGAGGYILVEMSPEQEGPLRHLANAEGFGAVTVLRDARGLPRALLAKLLAKTRRNRGASVV